MSTAIETPTTFQYLSKAAADNFEAEAKAIEDKLRGPLAPGVNRADLQKRGRSIRQTLETQSPPDLTPAQRDAAAKECVELEAKFVPGMLSGEEMRKNPAGAVDRHMAWERANKRPILRWKSLKKLLHKGDDSPNFANIEQFRPHTKPSDPSMHSAQIGGKQFFGTNPSPEYRENYDRIFQGESAVEAPKRKTAKPKRTPQVKEAMACGKQIAPTGQRMHILHCDECRGAQPAEAPQAATG